MSGGEGAREFGRADGISPEEQENRWQLTAMLNEVLRRTGLEKTKTNLANLTYLLENHCGIPMGMGFGPPKDMQ